MGGAIPTSEQIMSVRVQAAVLHAAAIASFVDAFLSPKDSEPGPWAAAVLAILLLRRALIRTAQPLPAVASGCILTALLIAGDHNFLHVKKPLWVGLVIVAGIVFAFWERIQKLWRSAQ